MTTSTPAPTVGSVDVPIRPGWHPGVDEFGDGFVVFATPDRVVLFTEVFASFVAEAVARGVRPVLLTAVEARVSAHVSLVMRASGGLWAVQRVDGATFDALSGYRIGALEELWAPAQVKGERLAGYSDTGVGVCGVVTFDVHAHLRVDERTLVGGVAQALTQMTGRRLECFGAREPLLEPWNQVAVTEVVRGVMPESQTLRVSGSGGVFGQVQVARTPTGLLEHTVVGIPLLEGVLDGQVVDVATAGLERIAERFGVTVGFAALMQYDWAGSVDAPVVVQGVRSRAPEAPVAVLVGPRGVRDLAVDFDGLAKAHEVRRLGRAKTPSMLVRFMSVDQGLWGQLAGFAAALGPASIARAAGMKAGA